ncbi:hypothetical protein IFM89_035356, partial [Coptis chinensis]
RTIIFVFVFCIESTFESQLKKKTKTETARPDILRKPRRPSRKASSTTNIVDDLTSIFGGNLVDFTLSLVLRDLENSRTLRGKLKKDEERDWIATNVHRSARSVEISFSLFVCVYDYLYLSSYKFFYGVSVLKQKHWQKRMSVTDQTRRDRRERHILTLPSN